MLKIDNLHVRVAGKDILKGLTLDVKAGEVHAIMGPNGAGKSTLGYVLAGREGYEVTQGTVTFNGQDLLALEPEARAATGVFLAFQYPVEIPGVNNTYFLKAALNAARRQRGESEIDAFDFLTLVREKLKVLHLKDELLNAPSTKASRAARRSATRSFRWPCSNPHWPSSTKPTPASISTH
jgi:Fe-S cluster assembly ATP-binding protein